MKVSTLAPAGKKDFNLGFMCLASRLSRYNIPSNTNETVGVLGMRVPRLACLWPTAWLEWGPNAAQLHQLKLKTLARGQALRGGQQEASSGGASSGRLVRRRRDQGRGTSRGARDASHDDRDQAGAGLCSVLVSPSVQRGQAQAKASGKGYRSVQQDQDPQNSRMEVIVEPRTASSSEPLAAEDQL